MGFLLPLSSMFFLWSSWISSSLEDHWCFRRPTLCSRSASNPIQLKLHQPKVSGQAVLCCNAEITFSSGSGRSHFPPAEKMKKAAICHPWVAVLCSCHREPMELDALAVKATLGLDLSESCHRDLQGRVLKQIHRCHLPPPCAQDCTRWFISWVGLVHCHFKVWGALLTPRTLPPNWAGNSSPGHWRRHPSNHKVPSASAEMWIKKCCSTARRESSCLLNTHLWSPWWLGQKWSGKVNFSSPSIYLLSLPNPCLSPFSLSRSDLHSKDTAAHRG